MTVETMYEQMKAKLSRVVPDVELRYKAELAYQINQLKQEKNAVILGHNYMEPALFHSIPRKRVTTFRTFENHVQNLHCKVVVGS